MNYLLLLQKLREITGGIFDSFMLMITELGQGLITFLLLAFIYWCVDKRAGQLMAANVSVASWFNQWIKQVFHVRRPWVKDARIMPVEEALQTASGYSMPSGHTTRATATWGTLGYVGIRKKDRNIRIIGIIAMLVVFMVMFSRNYLGVHTLKDVAVAFAIGMILIVLLDKILAWIEKGKNRDIVICITGCMIIFLPMLRFGCLSNAGASYGLIIGWLLERRIVGYKIETNESIVRKTIRFIPGAVVVVLALTIGPSVMSLIIPAKYALFFVNGFIGLFIMFLYPLTFTIYSSDNSKHKKILTIVIVVFCSIGIAGLGYKFTKNYLKDKVEKQVEMTNSADGTVIEHDDNCNVEPRFVTSTDTLIIAHRGYSGVAPENTLAAFKRAIDIDADMIELDVQMTKDGQLVIFHDDDMARITGISGRISDYTLEEIRALSAGAYYSAYNTGMTYDEVIANYGEELVPTLDEVLELMRECETGIYLELKDTTYSSLSDQLKGEFSASVVEKVDKYGMQGQVIYACFNYDYLKDIKNISEDNLILCNTTLSDANTLIEEYPSDYYGLYVDNVNYHTIEKLHEAGKKAFVWTANTPQQISNLVDMGVDGVVTNYPGVAKVAIHPEYSYLTDNALRTITIPEIYNYESDITENYIMQGMAKAGDIMAVTAYDYTSSGDSILYVMNTSGQVLNVIDLGFQAHVGGTAYDEARDLLWITGPEGNVYAVRWSSIASGTYTCSEDEIIYSFNPGLKNANGGAVASFLAMDGDLLYVGSYCYGSKGQLKAYYLNGLGEQFYEPKAVEMYTIPDRIQGATVAYRDDDRYLIMTQGYNTEDAALLSVKLEEGRNDYSEVDCSYTLPEGAEQPLMTANGLYILFESAARPYRIDARVPNDQIWLINWSPKYEMEEEK